MFTKRNNKLTEREKQVLKLIADGFTNREIADFLSVSIRTIEAHRSRIMIKLQIYDVPGLVKKAIIDGLTTPDQ